MTRLGAWARRHKVLGRMFPAPEPPIKGIVSAVAVSSSTLVAQRKPLSKQIEEVMSKAAMDCFNEGQNDPAVVKATMLAARAKFKKDSGLH